MTQKSKKPNTGIKIKIIDGKQNYSPFELSSKKKQEIKDKVDNLYNKFVKKNDKN